MKNVIWKERSVSNARFREAAFSRFELVVVLATVLVLAGAFIAVRHKFAVKSKENVCQENLRHLGVAMALYEQQNDDRIPFASISYSPNNEITWDMLIRKGLTDDATRAGASRPLQCPADRLATVDWAQKRNLHRRTYSMPKHDMKGTNWPPGPDNATGIGIWWVFRAGDKKSAPSPSVYNYEKTNQQAAFTTGLIPAPSATLLLVEQAWSNNIANTISRVWIDRTSYHLDTTSTSMELYHRGKFNYLMVDGHAAMLRPDETVGEKGEAGDQPSKHLGMWTVNPND